MKYKIILFSIILWGMSSCSLDDVKPLNRLTEDMLVRDAKGAQAVLNRAYSMLRSSKTGDFMVGLLAAGTEQRGEPYGTDGFSTNEVRVENTNILDDIYREIYYTINVVNYLLEKLEQRKNISGLSDSRKKQIMGEARTIRGFSYFRLLRVFGQFYDLNSTYGLVLSMSPIKNDKYVPQARSSVQKTYDVILADLRYGAENAPETAKGMYMSKVTAEALLSKVYLYMRNYQKASTHALAVIQNTVGYTLEKNYGDIFEKRWSSREVLYAPFGNDGNEPYTGTSYLTTWDVQPSPSFIALAELQDGVPGNGVGDTWTHEYTSGYDSRFLFGYSGKGGGQIQKYPYQPNTEKSGVSPYYYLRLAEVYLIGAEAEARNGNTDKALELVNQIRERAKMPLKKFVDKTTLITDIRQEKMLELYLENGESWFDLVRYHIEGDHKAAELKPTLKSNNQLIYPMPISAIRGNLKLKQNPGY